MLDGKQECHECENEVANYDIVTVDGEEKALCGCCAGHHEECQGCGSHDVVLSDYGVNLCGPCKANSTPEQKRWLNEQVYSEALETGRI